MLKGRTTIQLFNGKTGEVENSFVEENMVTNAASNILNPKLQWSFSGDNFANMLIQATPVCNQLFGGVMLWEKAHTENADNIVSAVKNYNVGNAGSAYSGTNPKRGSLNTAESGAIDGGYRFVWDFATDRANGTFNSITLTSRRGGNGGWGNTTDSDGGFLMSPTNMAESNVVTQGFKESGFSATSTYLKGCFAKNLYIYAKAADNVLNLTLASVANSEQLPITTSLNTTDGQVVSTEVKTATSTLTFCDTSYMFVDSEGMLHSLRFKTGQTFHYIKINPITAVILEEMVININSTEKFGSTSFAVYGGNLILFNQTRSCMCEYTKSGDYVKAIPELTSSGMTFGLLGNWLVSFYGTKAYIYDGDKVIISNCSYSSAPQIAYTYEKQYPYVLTSNFGYVLLAPFISTINNMTVPVTKTDSQTMKITYEVY